MVDVISSNCWLKPAILAMQLCQMLIQAQWLSDSPLLQLPHFTSSLISKFRNEKIEDIADFMNMEDEDRQKILHSLSTSDISDIIETCNRYPSIRIEKRVVEDEVRSGENVSVEVEMVREAEEEGKEFVKAPYFPKVN